MYKKHKLYKRAWRITVIPRTIFGGFESGDALVVSTSEFGDDKALRCTFDVESFWSNGPLFGKVTVYNLSADISYMLATQGTRVVIEAGYQDGAFGKIWDGDLYHYIEYRENVTDRVSEFHLMQGYGIYKNEHIMVNIPKGANIDGRWQTLTQSVRVTGVSSETTKKKQQKSVRDWVCFGEAKDYFQQTAIDAGGKIGLVESSGDSQYTITDFINEISKGPSLEVSPETGLIGTPTTIPLGVSFKTLLDPRLRFTSPPQQIQLMNTEVRVTTPQQVGATPLLYKNDGKYKVVRVQHTGDSRGNDWHTTVTGFVNPADALARGLV